ncbi:MAG: FHA domain-containing protein [Acidobacteriota bacterium]
MAEPACTLRWGDETIELAPGEHSVGRSRSCDVAINDPSVSRRHVLFTVSLGAVAVEDLGSSNGTYLNGRPLRGRIDLADGDTLALGDAELEVSVPAPPAPSHGEATMMLQQASVDIAAGLDSDPEKFSTRAFTAAPATAPTADLEPPAPDLGTRQLEVPTDFEPGTDQQPALPGPPLSLATQALPSAPSSPEGGTSPGGPPPGGPPPGGPLDEPPATAASPDVPPPPIATVAVPPAPAPPPDDAPAAEAPPAAPGMAVEENLPAPVRDPSRAPDEMLPSLDALDDSLFGAKVARKPPTTVPTDEVDFTAPPPGDTNSLPTGPAFDNRAPFLARLAGTLFDLLWMVALAAVLAFLFGEPQTIEALSRGGISALVLGLLVVLVGWATQGTTPGKLMLRHRVARVDGRSGGIGFTAALLRLIGVVINILTLGLGYLIAAFGGRGVHDHLAGTRVVKR